ncbi:MAG: hypothetical protein V9F01_14650 [Chitinophagaceae bacterium]
MKKILLLSALCTSMANIYAQKETFDLATYTPPKAWKKQVTESAVQFSTEDAAKATYCMITLFKALPGTANSKENFDLTWNGVVKEMVTVSTPPEMQAAATENGWETQSGYAPFESDGNKGVVVLVTSTGFEKMMSLIIITNTDAYEKEMTAFLESISLKKPAGGTGQPNKPVTNPEKPQQTKTTAKSDGFAFTTTDFDDGWTSTVQEDWVQVLKGNIKVLIHYPNKKADAYNSVVLDGLKNAWNILIAPKYSRAANMQFKSSGSWEVVEYAEADMVEKITGKQVYVVFFKKDFSNGSGKYIEFISPDKQTFEQEFGTYENASANFGTGPGFNKMANMANYNKFAVAASDLAGKWTSDFNGAIQYVNAYTGFDAGMDTHASNENFHFGSGNSYNWDLGVASGQVGNIKFQSRKSSGKFSMTGNWKANFSDIEGKFRTYDVHFSCIKGLRILWLDGKPFAKAQ